MKANERRYTIDEHVFDVLTPDSAYWAGYLLCDGNCTNENKVRICTASYDRDLVEKFREFVKSPDRPIRDFVLNDKYPNSSFEFRSDYMRQVLAQYGVEGVKADRPAPQRLFETETVVRDFVHGVFDADGSCFYDGNGKKYLFAEITGYMPMMEFLKKVLVKHGVIKESKNIVKNGKVWRLRFPKEDAKALFRFIYNGNSEYSLNRKRTIVEDYFNKIGAVLYG